MNYQIDPLQPILGYVLAATSTGVLRLANAIQNLHINKGWLELGGTVGLIGGLSYGCVTLWKSLHQQRSEFTQERAAFIKAKDELEREIRSDWKEQNAKLISVLERLEGDGN